MKAIKDLIAEYPQIWGLSLQDLQSRQTDLMVHKIPQKEGAGLVRDARPIPLMDPQREALHKIVEDEEAAGLIGRAEEHEVEEVSPTLTVEKKALEKPEVSWDALKELVEQGLQNGAHSPLLAISVVCHSSTSYQ